LAGKEKKIVFFAHRSKSSQLRISSLTCEILDEIEKIKKSFWGKESRVRARNNASFGSNLLERNVGRNKRSSGRGEERNDEMRMKIPIY
jgi:hypothetical protein